MAGEERDADARFIRGAHHPAAKLNAAARGHDRVHQRGQRAGARRRCDELPRGVADAVDLVLGVARVGCNAEAIGLSWWFAKDRVGPAGNARVHRVGVEVLGDRGLGSGGGGDEGQQHQQHCEDEPPSPRVSGERVARRLRSGVTIRERAARRVRGVALEAILELRFTPLTPAPLPVHTGRGVFVFAFAVHSFPHGRVMAWSCPSVAA